MVYESNDPGGDRQHSLKQPALHAVLDVVLLVAALRVFLLVFALLAFVAQRTL